ncbi:hypothetical protein PILCRDRAFT_378370 [Piloderma croceum F 1598]|uniref:Uncharacterized protein n=1 Tax=Piloderma croceum (strain F 1598) TaxID=765440 RepID=A0A0C3G2X3_PILCF|nr:hypothetical protein PILCRDRAFT_378370 [Piloderma croceum F 1598]
MHTGSQDNPRFISLFLRVRGQKRPAPAIASNENNPPRDVGNSRLLTRIRHDLPQPLSFDLANSAIFNPSQMPSAGPSQPFPHNPHFPQIPYPNYLPQLHPLNIISHSHLPHGPLPHTNLNIPYSTNWDPLPQRHNGSGHS